MEISSIKTGTNRRWLITFYIEKSLVQALNFKVKLILSGQNWSEIIYNCDFQKLNYFKKSNLVKAGFKRRVSKTIIENIDSRIRNRDFLNLADFCGKNFTPKLFVLLYKTNNLAWISVYDSIKFNFTRQSLVTESLI